MTTVSADRHTAVAAPRVRPAVVDGSTIWVECETWCTEDHVACPIGSLEDLSHSGPSVDVAVTRRNGPSRHLFSVGLAVDPFSPDPAARTPFLFVDEDETHYLDREDAADLADALIRAAAQIRDIAQYLPAREVQP